MAFLELSADHMIKDHVQRQHMTDHVVEDHEPQYHVITKDHVKDHPEEQHVTSDQHTILVG